MSNNKDNVSLLYNGLIKKGYTRADLGDEATFRNKLSDENNRRELYDYVSGRGDFRIGDYDTYLSRLNEAYTQPQPDDNAAFEANAERFRNGQPTEKVTTQSMIDAHPELGLQTKSVQSEEPKWNVPQYDWRTDKQKKLDELGNSTTATPVQDQYGNEYYPVKPREVAYDEAVRGLKDISERKAETKSRLQTISNDISNELNRLQSQVEVSDLDKFRPANLQSMPVNPVNQELMPEYTALRKAQRLVEESNNIIEEASKKGNTNFMAGLARGFWDNLNAEDYTFGADDAAQSAFLYRALDKAEKGESLTKAEETLLDAAAINMAVQSYYAQDLGKGYGAGQVTAESLPFMLEMAINPISASGKTTAKALLKYGLKKFAKNKAAKVGARLAGDALAATGMAATTGFGDVLEGTTDRLAQNYNYQLDDEGRLHVEKKNDEMGMGEAFARSFATRAIENQSEMIFRAFDGLGGFMKGVQNTLPGGVNKYFEMLSNNKLADVYRAIKNSPVFRNYLVKDFRNATQIGGYVEERMEELYNDLANFAIGEMSFDQLTDLDRNIDTSLGLIPTQLMFGILGLSGAGAMRYQTRRTLEDLQATMNEQQRKELEGLLDMGLDAEEVDVRGFIRNIMQNENYTIDNKRDMIKAAFYVAKQNGIDQLTNADVVDKVNAENALIDSMTDPSTGVYSELTATLTDKGGETVEVPGYIVGWFGEGEKRQPVFVAEGMENNYANRRVLKPDQWNPESIQQMPAEQVKAVNEEMIREEAAAQAERESKYAPEVLSQEMQQGVPFETEDAIYLPISPMLEGNGWVVEVQPKGVDNKVAAQPFTEELTNDQFHDMLQAQLDTQEASQAQAEEAASNTQAVVENMPRKTDETGRIFVPTSVHGDEVAYDIMDAQGNTLEQGTSKVSQFAKMQDYVAPVEEQLNDDGTSGESVGEQVNAEVNTEVNNSEIPNNSNISQVENAEQPQEPTLESVVASLPKTKKGDIDYEAMTPQQQYQYTSLSESPEVALEDLQADIAANEEELVKMQEELGKARGGKRAELRDKVKKLTSANEELKAFYESVAPKQEVESEVAQMESAEPTVYAAEKATTESEPVIVETEKPKKAKNPKLVGNKKKKKNPEFTEEELQPMDALEFAAHHLGLGNVSITSESFKKETGYGEEERKKFMGIIRTTEKGGMTVEQAAEKLVSLDNEANGRFFNNDTQVARDTIIELLRFEKWGDVTGLIKNNRLAERKKREEAEYAEYEAALMESLHVTPEEFELLKESLAQRIQDLDVDFNIIDAIFAEAEFERQNNEEYEQGRNVEGNQGKSELLPETRAGDLGGNQRNESQQTTEGVGGRVDDNSETPQESPSGSEVTPSIEATNVERMADIEARILEIENRRDEISDELTDIPSYESLRIAELRAEEWELDQEQAELEAEYSGLRAINDESRAIIEAEGGKASFRSKGSKTNTPKDEFVKRAEEWSEKTGVKVKFANRLSEVSNRQAREQLLSGEKITGWYEKSTGEVVLYLPNLSSMEEVDATYIHEVVAHKGMSGLLGDRFNEFLDSVWDMMSLADKRKYWDYPGVSSEKNEEDRRRAAADEYIANTFESIDVTESVWSKLTDLIKRFLKAIGIEPRMTNADIANTIKKSYQRLLSGEGAEGNVSGEGTRFRTLEEVNKTFNEQLQKQIDGTLPKGHIYQLGNPSAALQFAGIADLPIILSSSKLSLKSSREYTSNHPFDLEDVKNLVIAIQEPVAIFNSEEGNGKKVILTELKDKNGNNFLAIIDVRRFGRRNFIDVNSTISLYPKDNATRIAKWFDSEKAKLTQKGEEPLLRWADKKKASIWLTNHSSDVNVVGLSYKRIAKIINSFEDAKDLPGNSSFRVVKDKNELVAVHNISEDNLRKVLSVGGLIMPSIAITKADMGHEGYGEISLLFDKETINPSDRRNKVYGGDAWTPRFPHLEMKLNEKIVSNFGKKIRGLLDDNLRNLYSISAEVYPDNIERVLANNGVEGYYGKEWMKFAYLLDNGKKVKIPMKPKDYGSMSEIILDMAKERGLKASDIMNEGFDFYQNNPDFVNSILEIKNKDVINNLPEGKRDAARKFLKREISYSYFDSLISQAVKMEYDLEHGGLKQIIDRSALSESIEKKVKTNNADYNKWVDGLFDGIIDKYGIRNNRDMFTNSGSQRSWEQLHDAATPANILKYMLAENEQGGSGGFFDSNIMGASAETYESIEEIREKGKKRLRRLEEGEYEEWGNSVAERMSEICNDFLSPKQRNEFGASIDAKIDITNAVAKDKTAKGIYKEMKREYPSFTMEHAKKVEEIVKEIQDFAIGYFEAKPRRIVPLSEVRKAIVPKKTSEDILEGLKNNGIEVATYKRGDEAARARLIKKESDGIRFRRVYHGSGASFDRFDHSFMGTGEGNQSFGWGSYVTEVEGIGKQYGNIALNGKNKFKYVGDKKVSKYTLKDAEQIMDESGGYKEMMKRYGSATLVPGTALEKAVKFLKSTNEEDWEGQRHLYEVEIPDNDGTNYIAWDKMLPKEQAERIKDAVRQSDFFKAYQKEYGKLAEERLDAWTKTSGGRVYNHLGNFTLMDGKAADKAISQLLSDAGFVGIEYPTNYMRGGDETTKNYVIFNEHDLDIVEHTRFRIANRNQEIFVSNAQRAVEGIKQEKATPQQWLAMIEKNGGLKAGEDKWLGLSDWLKESDKKSLTKAEILDFIGQNKIVIEEVHYNKNAVHTLDLGWGADVFNTQYEDMGGEFRAELATRYGIEEEELKNISYTPGIFISTDLEMATKVNKKLNFVDENSYDFNEPFDAIAFKNDVEGALFIDIEEMRREFQTKTIKPINSTRLNYTTKGLENKQEIALVVPTIDPWNESDEIHFGDAGAGRAVAWVRFGETTTPNVAFINAREAVNNYIAEMREKYNVKGGGIYDVMNEEEVKRLQELTSAEFDTRDKVERVLVIDEIQSKRHQEGREHGYVDMDAYNKEKAALDEKSSELMRKRGELNNRLKEKYGDFTKYTKRIENGYSSKLVPNEEVMTPEEIREWNETSQESIIKAERELDKKYRDGIPAAPFEKNWHELAMKRMLRYAAENGFDKVAWTKGEQQAERYNIGNTVERIERDRDGALIRTYGSDISLDFNEDGVIASGEYEGRSLAEVLGKEMALKVMSLKEGESIEGDGLRIGGEGMKGFYDKMLPSFVNKYVKKWGTKVQDVELPNVEEAGRFMHSVDVTEAMKESVMEGQTMFRLSDKGRKIQNEVDKFTEKYNSKETVVVEVASMTDEEIEEMFDSPASEVKEALKEGLEGGYSEEEDKIYIFADNQPLDDMEDTMFHENLHGLLGEHPEFIGEFFERAADKLPKLIKKLEKLGYTKEEIPEEAFVRVATAGILNGDLYYIRHYLPEEKADEYVELLNNFGYEQRQEFNSRILGSVGQQTGSTSGEERKGGTVVQENDEKKDAEKEDAELREEARRERQERLTELFNRVADTGLQGVLGDKNYDRMMMDIYSVLPEDARKEVVDDTFKHYGHDFVPAVSDYINAKADGSLWDKIVAIVREALRKVGFDIDLNANEVRYLAWRSQKKLDRNNLLDVAEDIDKKYRLKVGEYNGSPTRFRAKKPQKIDIADNRPDIIKKYDEALKKGMFNFQEAFQDRMLSLKVLMDEIVAATGKSVRSFEDAYKAENQLSSNNKEDQNRYIKKFYTPLIDYMKELSKKYGEETVRRYVYCKSGLERNEVLRQRDADEAYNQTKEELDEKLAKNEIDQAQYNVLLKQADNQRKKTLSEDVDYSGIRGMLFNVRADELFKQYEAGTITKSEYERKIKDLEQNKKTVIKDWKDFAEHSVADLERRATSSELDALWNKINAATNETLRIDFESGMIDRATYEAEKKMMKYYIPLRNWENTTAEDMYEYRHDMTPVVSSNQQKAKGRESEAFNPIASIAKMAENAIIRGNRNKMKMKLYSFVVNRPTALANVLNVWYVKDPKTGTWDARSADISGANTEDEIKQAIEQFENDMKLLNEQGLAFKGKVKSGMEFRASKKQKAEHVVTVMINGNEYEVSINGNPRAAQAVNGLTNAEGVNDGYAWIDSLKRLYGGGLTSWNPDFVIPNLVRDTIHASTMTFLDKGVMASLKYMANIPKIFSQVTKEVSGVGFNNPQLHQYFEEFVSNGGETGYTAVHTLEDYKKEYKKLMDEAKGLKSKIKRGAKIPFEKIAFVLEAANRIAEDVNRFNAYVTSRESGGNIVNSIDAAKNITVNFNRKGALNANNTFYGKIASFMNRWILFFNPSVQGIYQLVSKSKMNPGRAAFLGASIISSGFFIPMLNEMLVAAFGDDDEDDYWNQSDYKRRNNWMLFVGDGYVSIPLPPVLREIYGMGDIVYGLITGHIPPQRAIYDIFNQVQSAVGFVKLLPEVSQEPDVKTWLKGFAPDLAAPFLDVMSNTNFMGRPIAKWTDFNESDPEHERVYKGVSKHWIELSKFINESGGNETRRSDWWGNFINPAMMEHLVTSYTGGIGKTINNFVGMAVDASTGDKENMDVFRKAPIIPRFYTPNDEKTVVPGINRKFYEFNYQYNNAKKSLKKSQDGVKSGEHPEWQKYIDEMKENGEMEFIKYFEKENKKLKKIQNLLKGNPTNKKELEQKEIDKKAEIAAECFRILRGEQ